MFKDQNSHPVDKEAPETLLVARKHERKGDRHKGGGCKCAKKNQEDLEAMKLKVERKVYSTVLSTQPMTGRHLKYQTKITNSTQR